VSINVGSFWSWPFAIAPAVPHHALVGLGIMASYIIAGKANDDSFARAEFAAKQIEASCPNIFFRFEMKHPDIWPEFISAVFRKYDFTGAPENFPCLVWTHEGELIGGAAEFIQQICVEKFGIPAPPAVNDKMWTDISRDNGKQVRLQQHRELNGPPFSERCEAACKRALGAGLFSPPVWSEEKRSVMKGASMEVWVSNSLAAERAKLREDFGNGEPIQIDAGLAVTTMGPEQSHSVLLHPRPLVAKQLVLAPRRFVKEVSSPGSEDQALLEVPPHTFRNSIEEDLGEADFMAAMEVMTSIGGVTCWMGLRGGSEYRSPLDTHLQVLPFPVHHRGEDSPLRFPLELTYERAVKDQEKSLKVFPFQHSFSVIADDKERKTEELAKKALSLFEQFRGKSGPQDAFALAFTTTWLCLMPLEPPEQGSPRHEAWLQMPPPPPCALFGIVVCPTVATSYPETAKLSQVEGAQLVSTRAEEEGILEGSPEYDEAVRQVRINTRITEMPLEIIGNWAKKR
jgi:hypothetical protein